MRCEEIRARLSAYLDGEVTSAERQAIARHLAGCAACAAIADDYRHIGTTLAATAAVVPPADLSQRLAERLPATATREPAAPMSRAGYWTALAAGVLAMAMLAGFVGWQAALRTLADDRLGRDAISAHLRALLHEAPSQITSADTHTVKPWFAGRLDFAPEVKDLSREGFTLVGGRLDVIDDRRVASLVYKRRQHTISVFVWPAPRLERMAARVSRHNGFNYVIWSSGGMNYAAVSDLNAGELTQLVGLY